MSEERLDSVRARGHCNVMGMNLFEHSRRCKWSRAVVSIHILPLAATRNDKNHSWLHHRASVPKCWLCSGGTITLTTSQWNLFPWATAILNSPARLPNLKESSHDPWHMCIVRQSLAQPRPSIHPASCYEPETLAETGALLVICHHLMRRDLGALM